MSVFNKLGTFQRSAKTQDAQGTWVEDWTDPTVIAADVPVSIQHDRHRDSRDADRRAIVEDFAILTKRKLALTAGDRMVDSDGTVYVLQNDPEDLAGRGLCYEIPAKRVQ